MLKPKPLFMLFFLVLVVLAILKYLRTRKFLPMATPTDSTTCLDSFDPNRLYKSVFHMSMVQFMVPKTLSHWVENKSGFEIGAPSASTWGNLGLYDAAAKVDATNFAAQTLWESGIKEGGPFLWKNRTLGKHFIRDAVDLHGIPDESYDFVCGTDILEHVANPFKALLEWLRIMKPNGLLIVIVPYQNVTFDHKRSVAKIEHLMDDYRKKVTEKDLTHLDEILRLHDLGRDAAAGGFDAFKARSEKNFEIRGLHQHVYDQRLLYYIYRCLNIEVKSQYIWDYHQLIIGQKR
ncbi:unnamed protein product [Adineta ricciae]|uniref:Methyltransferase type 11 domain-containing protein n=1 Tax=Adineta ricciae TaxID=249248 RepID=A0A816CJR0_ADIRI|nr:unnamed protein product [Adineta ricciae]